MNKYLIAPSILSADFAQLGKETEQVLTAGADIIHFDVMDNHYVPNLTFGPMICKALRNHGITAPIDVHLMVQPVDNMIERFAEAGASRISFHPEASQHVHRSLDLIRQQGCEAGLAFNPGTPLQCLDYLQDVLDFIVIMSVNPGFGGQSFIESSLEKIKAARNLLNSSVRITVDGGININNIKRIADAGADTFVAGSAIFNSEDYHTTITAMRSQLGQ